jgi:hypothetical protein
VRLSPSAFARVIQSFSYEASRRTIQRPCRRAIDAIDSLATA